MKTALLTIAALAASCASTTPAVLGPNRSFVLRVEGNESIPAAELARAVSFELDEYEEGDRAPAFADDTAYQAETYYRQSGFHFVDIQFERLEEADPPELVLHVEEGPRVYLDAEGIEEEGIREFNSNELLTLLDPRRTGILGTGSALFVEDELIALRSELEREYLARGFREVEVEEPVVTFSADRTSARVRFKALEGPRYVCGTAVIEDYGGLPAEVRELLDGVCRSFPTGEAPDTKVDRRRNGVRPSTPRLPFELRGELIDSLGAAGYPEAEVHVEVAPSEFEGAVRTVGLVARITPGPLITVGEVTVEGNTRTRSDLVLSRLRLDRGQTWNNEKIRSSLRSLYRTGLFRRIEIERTSHDPEHPDDGERDLTIHVEEAPTRELFIEPGYGSWELFRLKAGFRERNLAGTGRMLRVEGTTAVRANRGLIGLRDPWLFRSDFDLIGDLTASYDERENPSYVDRSTGVGAFLTKEWSRHQSTTFGFQYRRSEAFDLEVLDEDVIALLTDIDIASLRLSHRRDYRDNPLLPSRGFLVEGGVEWGDGALGSELDFIRGTAGFSSYRRLGARTVLAASYRTGVVEALGDDDFIPIQERFFNGGENTVRSFQTDRLGPTDSEGNPIGGQAFQVLNLELRRPIGFSQFEAAVFVDAGSLGADASDWEELSDLRYGIGAGLRYLLPIGPVRLDAAVNPSPREGEDDYSIHFAIGIAF